MSDLGLRAIEAIAAETPEYDDYGDLYICRDCLTETLWRDIDSGKENHEPFCLVLECRKFLADMA